MQTSNSESLRRLTKLWCFYQRDSEASHRFFASSTFRKYIYEISNVLLSTTSITVQLGEKIGKDKAKEEKVNGHK